MISELNFQLIKDEAHRNSMSLSELNTRMDKWLSKEYSAALFTLDQQIIGYVLWRNKNEFIYIRQFFIVKNFRSQGLGKKAFHLAKEKYWVTEKLRLEVLVHNETAIQFWNSVGFKEYCITMES